MNEKRMITPSTRRHSTHKHRSNEQWQSEKQRTTAIHSTINSPTNTIDLDEYEYEEEEPPQRNAQCHSITIQNTRQNRTIPTIIRTRGACITSAKWIQSMEMIIAVGNEAPQANATQQPNHTTKLNAKKGTIHNKQHTMQSNTIALGAATQQT
eukprot:1077300_1